MALMKFAFFFLTLSALFEAYQARHLKDVFINKRVDRRLPSKGVIQMITKEEYKTTAYGRLAEAPPPPKVAPSKGEETYGQDNPKAPQSQSVAPPQVMSITPPQIQTNCAMYNLKGPNDTPSGGDAPPIGETTYGQDNSKKEPSTTPPQVQTNCATYNLKGPINDAPSQGETTYGRDNPKREPSTSVAPPQVHINCDRYNLKGPNDASSQGEKTFSLDNPKRPSSVAPDQGQTSSYNLKSYVMKLLNVWSSCGI